MPSFAAKQLVLPFWAQKNKEPQEAAAIFAVAELNRNRGGGLLSKQPPEKLVCITKIGYPLWMFPKNGTTLIFDGLNDKDYNIPYTEIPSPETFTTSLEQKQHPRENYATFLADHTNYFSQPQKEKHFTLRGLIAEEEFREEISNYRKEAIETTQPDTLLSPTLEEATIAATIQELGKLEGSLRAEEEKLDKCLQLLKKTTNQYITEIDYQIAATTEEADAKIKAQEELDKPQTTKLNKEYSRKLKNLTENFEGKLDSFVKLQLKIQTSIEKTQDNIEQYKQEAKAHAKKGHKIYEKRWKEKIKKAEKELSELKKEMKKIDESTKKTSRQKEQDIAELNFEWDTKIKLVCQPLVVLEETKNAKITAFRQESIQLREIEKPVLEGIEKTLRYRAVIEAVFEGLGFSDPALRAPSVVYVPFYVVRYKTDLAIRYLFIAPSIIQKADFSSKLKGALGMSKTRDLLAPRFNSVANFIKQAQEYTQKNSAFEKQFWGLAEKNNLLKNSTFQTNIKNGLSMLQEEGHLSQREIETLIRQLEA
ncbi:hypothetical protein [Candidatus Bathycorpusculum sp.]|uniref:hypothetical protein n=1 Tax=Candidatus Bathycorpusculum sp. TaxID=2994959 RepID=UPI00282569BC|nr:hypothetical protein [Candidatus Termitimicrobium sp.]MCL2686666.1 hypothetical protein [Candidatus Termitimicrobium sp.]